MRRIVGSVLTVLVLASACSAPADMEASRRPAAVREQDGESALPAEPPEDMDMPEEIPAGLPRWSKPVKPTPADIRDEEYWWPVFTYLDTYRDSFVRDAAPIIAGDYTYPLTLHLSRLGAEVPGDVLSFDQYALLVELFWGAPAAREEMEYVRGVTGEHYNIDPQTRTVRLYPEEPRDIFRDQYEIQSIDIPGEGVEEVTLTIGYHLLDGEPYKTIEYRLFWHEWGGYLPLAISWQYTPTDRVSVEGDAALFPLLWGEDAAYTADYSVTNLKYSRDRIVAIGSTAYRFRPEGATLLADTLHLDTLEQAEGVLVYRADGDILGVYPGPDGVVLYTGSRVLRLGRDLQEEQSAPLPGAVHLEDAVRPVFSPDLSHMAYSLEDGLYLCALGEESQPQLLREHRRGETVVDYEYLYPLEFLEGERLYVAAEMWEAMAGYYVVLSLAGEELQRLAYFTSGEHSGGYHSHSPLRAIHYWSGGSNRTYSFADGRQEDAAWLAVDYGAYCSDAYDPEDPEVWYMCVPTGTGYKAEGTTFLRVDFHTQTTAPLPLVVHGANAGVLAVSDAGHLLFVYAYRGESGFGVAAVR